jgi:Tfp pilus assembly protein PilF
MTRVAQLAIASITAVYMAGSIGCATLTKSIGWERHSTTSAEELPKGKTLEVCLSTADQLAAQGHSREAMLLYERARGIDPSAIDYSRRLAGLYDLQGDLPKATAEFQAALAKSPDDPDLLNDFACFLDRQGNHAEAEVQLRHALVAAPHHQRALTNLGIVLAHQNRFQEAFDSFASAVGPAAAHNNVGMLLARQGRTAEAAVAFDKAIALDASLAQARAGAEFLRGR